MVSTVQKTVEDLVEFQQVQILDRVVDLFVVQRQVPMVLTVQRPVEIPQVPQLQFIDKFVDIPVVVVQRHVPMVLTVQMFIDKFVDISVVSQRLFPIVLTIQRR